MIRGKICLSAAKVDECGPTVSVLGLAAVIPVVYYYVSSVQPVLPGILSQQKGVGLGRQ